MFEHSAFEIMSAQAKLSVNEPDTTIVESPACYLSYLFPPCFFKHLKISFRHYI